jgi:hypothetical protein
VREQWLHGKRSQPRTKKWPNSFLSLKFCLPASVLYCRPARDHEASNKPIQRFLKSSKRDRKNLYQLLLTRRQGAAVVYKRVPRTAFPHGRSAGGSIRDRVLALLAAEPNSNILFLSAMPCGSSIEAALVRVGRFVLLIGVFLRERVAGSSIHSVRSWSPRRWVGGSRGAAPRGRLATLDWRVELSVGFSQLKNPRSAIRFPWLPVPIDIDCALFYLASSARGADAIVVRAQSSR